MNANEKAPSAGYRRNLYWRPELEDKVQRAAEALTNLGVRGLYLSSGEVNRGAVIERLADYLLEQQAEPDK